MNIELRKWNFDLKNELINICNNVDRTYLTNRMPYPYTQENADYWLNMISEHDEKDGIFRAIIVDDQVVGSISIEPKDSVYVKSVEIGYILLTPYWSKGIMSEATRQICEIAFDQLDINRITAKVFAPNKASIRVLEKNGFEFEGLQKSAIYKDGIFYDLALYGKLK